MTPEGIKGPPPQPASQEEITETALWHLFDYDQGNLTFSLMRIEESLYREASFLDQRIANYKCPMVRYELKHMAQMFPRQGNNRGAMGFIFHVGHCGSTLLSRALGVSRKVLPFREPMTLRTLSADHRELDTPMSFMKRSDWEWLATTVIDSLARRFRPEQVNVVKATSTGNNLIAPILEESERHRAVLLYVPLETYLATMLANARQGGDLWGQARTRMQDWIRIYGEPDFALHQLEAPQLAVLSWLTSMSYMLTAKASDSQRLMLLDFEDLIEEPVRHLAETASFFQVETEADEITKRFPEVASGYSKRPDQPFTPEMRAQKLNRTRSEQGDSIRAGMQWAKGLIADTPGLKACEEFLN